MSTALAVREPPRVYLGHPRRCRAALCDVPSVAVCVFLTPDWTQLRAEIICKGHLLMLRETGGCLLFPLDAVPPLERLRDMVSAEIARRRAPRFAGNAFGNTGGFTFTFTTTTTPGGWG